MEVRFLALREPQLLLSWKIDIRQVSTMSALELQLIATAKPEKQPFLVNLNIHSIATAGLSISANEERRAGKNVSGRCRL